MITKTDAMVLKTMKFRDTSKIVTFYTRQYGKLKGVAKGARQMRSKFGASLEPMTRVSLVHYRKEHRDLQLISQCDIVRYYKRIHTEIERMSVALSILDLVNQLAHDEEENAELYRLLIETFDQLEQTSKNYPNLFYAFELRLAGLFGFSPVLEVCNRCGRKVEEFGGERSVIFQLSRGGILCSECARTAKTLTAESISATRPDFDGFSRDTRRTDGNIRVSIPSLKIMQRLFLGRLEGVCALEYPKGVGNEIDATIRLYLRNHFEDLKPLKSTEVFQKILN
jgi:DNA repair protein RecO (recombination protein O)